MGAALAAAGAIAACSASSDTGSGNAFGNSQSTNDGSGAGNATGNPQGTGANTSASSFVGSGPSGTNTGTATNTGTNTGAGGGDQCGGTALTAEPVPLDLYIMLDQSGSMSEATSTGPTKWQSVTTALENFFTDPSSQGIAVGIQFFPLLNAGVPPSCASQSCGSFGPCENQVCKNAFQAQSLVFCDGQTPCPGSDSCVSLGQCAADNTYVCLLGAGPCGAGRGNCVTIPNPTCLSADSCSASDYGTPDVPIAMLGTSQNQALDSAISAHGPTGSTPTSAALQGAVDYAGTYAGQNPNDTVVVVLATDGIPTECSPTDPASIAAIAAAGNAATPSIKTFVIGVFSPTDDTASAQTTLNDIAQAGSGQNAFIISTNGDVGTQFTMALDAIRANKLQCTYQVPPPQQGQMQDFGKVNVEYTPPNQSMSDTINYVESMANCDPTTGGWYYNVDPANGGTPTQIIMCPETCTEFGNGGAVDIRVGCKTQIGPH